MDAAELISGARKKSVKVFNFMLSPPLSSSSQVRRGRLD
jgi:hypothetical protein